VDYNDEVIPAYKDQLKIWFSKPDAKELFCFKVITQDQAGEVAMAICRTPEIAEQFLADVIEDGTAERGYIRMATFALLEDRRERAERLKK
jgi:hypothetical protein